ncbi:unnamed protein product [Prunus armeniaca]|uniref:Uncharacterized protein n=1 Tax=Prunus armeniaca TaxID=36596 RepID=A0A6J5X809_PRUAR|nr:unnamed protein product [Prunus armeniaca]
MQSKQITLKIESVRSNSENALASVFVKISIPEIHGAKSEAAVTRENKSEVVRTPTTGNGLCSRDNKSEVAVTRDQNYAKDD